MVYRGGVVWTGIDGVGDEMRLMDSLIKRTQGAPAREGATLHVYIHTYLCIRLMMNAHAWRPRGRGMDAGRRA